jgi:hypothetical protein
MLHLSAPLTTAGEVGKMLGEKWKALDEKKRQPYEAKAAADKKRYEEEKAAYQVSYPSLPTRRPLTRPGVRSRGRRGGGVRVVLQCSRRMS